jgi:hypothetical protein
MNNILSLRRNNIQMGTGNGNIMISSPPNNKNNKNKKSKDYSQEILLKNLNNNNSNKTPKYFNNTNLIFDSKRNIKNKNYSKFEKNDKSDILMNSKIYNLETEPNKNNNNIYFTKLTKKNYNDIFFPNTKRSNKKPTSDILSTYYTNKSLKLNKINNISIKKSPKNYGVNFNYNSPNAKYQSFTRVNKYINRDIQKLTELSTEKNINRKNFEFEKKSINLRRPLSSLSSNIYLNTENSINYRNNSHNNALNRFNNMNYNLTDVFSSKGKNINATPKINYHNYMNLVNNSQSKKKTKSNYSFNQNQNNMKVDKAYLNKFYEETFSDSYESKNNFKNKDNNNNDDIIYKENLTTNQSTYINASNKIKNLKKNVKSIKINNDDKIENFEELHFFIVSSLQKGKNTGKFFK